MTQATYDDVNLILRLYELRREEKMRLARAWFVGKFHARTIQEVETLCPLGSEENAYLRMVTSYWDMVASFVTAGVLNQEMFFQSGHGEALLVWERVAPLADHYRQMMKNPKIFANLERVAGAAREWMNRENPEAYEAFRTRVTARPAA